MLIAEVPSSSKAAFCFEIAVFVVSTMAFWHIATLTGMVSV